MAASLDEWTVLIVSDDKGFDMTCRMVTSTSLKELMQMWRDEHKLFGRWVFVSPDAEIEYTDDEKTLQDIGESFPNSKIITLRVLPFSARANQKLIEIFVFAGGKCHDMYVKPTDQLHKLLSRFAIRRTSYKYKGEVLDLKQTVKEAGLQQKAVVYESTVRTCVQLSTGDTKSFRVPTESLVSQLKTVVAVHEKGDFTLTYRGRTLQLSESIKDLKGLLKVSRVSFDVNINDKCIKWEEGSGRMKFMDFVCQLHKRINIDSTILEETVFECSGCGRRIMKSEEEYQVIETDCCRRRSLTLTAKLPSETTGVIATTGEIKSSMSSIERISKQSDHKRHKLLVFFYSRQFQPDVSRTEIEKEGKYRWSPPYIKCQVDVPKHHRSKIDFSVLRSALQPLLIANKRETRIERIEQLRGEVNGREVVLVTSSKDDEVADKRLREKDFCDRQGAQFSNEQVAKKQHQVREGGEVLVIPGRRTVLQIFKN